VAVAQITDAEVETEGSAGAFKVGIGVRPYLTSMESSFQLFLFGNLSYNFLNITREFKSASITLKDLNTDQTFESELTARELEEDGFRSKVEENDSKFGLGLGFGFEVPAGGSINLILQTMANVIFSEYNERDADKEEENYISFMGFTVGIVF
jgi:hypothetical protein